MNFLPEVKLSENQFNFHAFFWGKKLTNAAKIGIQTLTGILMMFLVSPSLMHRSFLPISLSTPLTIGLGLSVGVGCILGFQNVFVLAGLGITALLLAVGRYYSVFRRRRLMVKYRKLEPNLIKGIQIH